MKAPSGKRPELDRGKSDLAPDGRGDGFDTRRENGDSAIERSGSEPRGASESDDTVERKRNGCRIEHDGDAGPESSASSRDMPAESAPGNRIRDPFVSGGGARGVPVSHEIARADPSPTGVMRVDLVAEEVARLDRVEAKAWCLWEEKKGVHPLYLILACLDRRVKLLGLERIGETSPRGRITLAWVDE